MSLDHAKITLEGLAKTTITTAFASLGLAAVIAFKHGGPILTLFGAEFPPGFAAFCVALFYLGSGIHVVRLLHNLQFCIDSEFDSHTLAYCRIHPWLLNPLAETPGVVGATVSIIAVAAFAFTWCIGFVTASWLMFHASAGWILACSFLVSSVLVLGTASYFTSALIHRTTCRPMLARLKRITGIAVVFVGTVTMFISLFIVRLAP